MQQAEIRVRGRVQGVGFRPAVWRIARELGLSGDVRNDGGGVLIRVAGEEAAISSLVQRLRDGPPRLARIEQMDRRAIDGSCTPGFCIIASVGGEPRTEIAPDAAVCAECAREVLDGGQRRSGYAFANCTQYSPKLKETKATRKRSLVFIAGRSLC